MLVEVDGIEVVMLVGVDEGMLFCLIICKSVLGSQDKMNVSLLLTEVGVSITGTW